MCFNFENCYRILYSIFDQIAFVVNAFWELDFPERYAAANNVFNTQAKPSKDKDAYNKIFEKAKRNRALMALYWSHLDFVKRFKKSEFPSEKELKVLRNALEHKFVKIHVDGKNGDFLKKLEIEKDDFYHISEEQLKRYTLRLLQLAREWIIELVYAINIEQEQLAPSALTKQLRVFDYDDKFKL